MTEIQDMDVNEFCHKAAMSIIAHLIAIGEVLEEAKINDENKQNEKHKLPKRLEKGWVA